MKALQLLQEMDYQCRRDLYKNVPEHAVLKITFSDSTANGLTKAILSFLKLKGHMVWRQSSEGRYRPGKAVVDVIGRTRIMKGKYLPGQNKGAADVCAIIGGVFCALEVKIGKDSQSLAQKQYQKQVEDNGGRYFIARTFESFYEWYLTNDNNSYNNENPKH